jgi:hypothetical protein
MAKSINPDILDAALDEISGNATLMIACSAEPTDRTEAVTTYALADVSVSSGDFSKSDFSGGRRLVIAAKPGVEVDANGTATHVALVSGTELLFVTQSNSIALTTSDEITIPEWEIRIPGPA